MDFVLAAFESSLAAQAGVSVAGRAELGTEIELQFVISDPNASLILPQALARGVPTARKDGLWKKTCAELFVTSATDSSYVEINLSPSGEWNSYLFSDYREGMQPADLIVSRLFWDRVGDKVAVHATIELNGFTYGNLINPAFVGEASTGILHFASTHPIGKPDFHRRDYYLNYATRNRSSS